MPRLNSYPRKLVFTFLKFVSPLAIRTGLLCVLRRHLNLVPNTVSRRHKQIRSAWRI